MSALTDLEGHTRADDRQVVIDVRPLAALQTSLAWLWGVSTRVVSRHRLSVSLLALVVSACTKPDGGY
jgi:hypothetical protein